MFVFNRNVHCAPNDKTPIVSHRTKEDYDSAQYGLLFDFDGNINNQFNIVDGNDLHNLLVSIAPDTFKDVTYSWNYSASARILLPDGELANDKCGIHLFYMTKGPITPEQYKNFGKLAILAGYHEVKVQSNNVVVVRPFFDQSVQSPERQVFESDPMVSGGLTLRDYEIEIVNGSKSLLPPLPQLTMAQEKEYLTLANELKLNKQAELGIVTITDNRVTGKTRSGKPITASKKNFSRLATTTNQFFDPKTTTVIDRHGDEIDLDSIKPGQSVPCYIPSSIRIDNGASGSINRSQAGRLNIYDYANEITYYEQPELPKDKLEDVKVGGYSERFVSREMFPDDLTNKLILLKSPMGTGKTTLLKTLRQELGKDRKSEGLIISHRESLARQNARNIPKVTSYKDRDWQQAKWTSFCLDSIYKLNETNRSPDTVIIDEIEQTLEHLCSSTIGSKTKDKGWG